MSARILVVDDEEIVIRSCLRILEGEYQVDTAQSGREALAKADDNPYDVVLLDIMMPRMDGLEVLRKLKEVYPEIEVIMVTGLSQVGTAVRAMKLGAFDYMPKPFDPDELALVVQRAVERRRLLEENGDSGSKYGMENIIGSSPRMQQLFRLIAKCAPTNTTVLLTGESGTGKELIARAIHHNSLRKEKPFVPVDCTSLSENLLESELFGHVRGSFTGAVSDKKGMFEIAHGGTLFLDEVANIPVSVQAKLLRVIQEREFRAVGDTRTRPADIRLIAATNRELRGMVAEGKFRDDLFYRINIFPVGIPPLRERQDDIPALAAHFLKLFGTELGRQEIELSDSAMNVLLNYDWPGNVRELENAMHRAVILATDKIIRHGHLVSIVDMLPRLDVEVPRTGEELKQVKKTAREKSVESIEKLFVLEALKRNAWNVTRSAEETGMQRANFQALMKKHHIRLREGAPEPQDAERKAGGEFSS